MGEEGDRVNGSEVPLLRHNKSKVACRLGLQSSLDLQIATNTGRVTEVQLSIRKSKGMNMTG